MLLMSGSFRIFVERLKIKDMIYYIIGLLLLIAIPFIFAYVAKRKPTQQLGNAPKNEATGDVITITYNNDVETSGCVEIDYFGDYEYWFLTTTDIQPFALGYDFQTTEGRYTTNTVKNKDLVYKDVNGVHGDIPDMTELHVWVMGDKSNIIAHGEYIFKRQYKKMVHPDNI